MKNNKEIKIAFNKRKIATNKILRSVLQTLFLVIALGFVPMTAYSQLSMVKGFYPSSIPPGSTSTLTIVVNNSGPTVATNLTLNDNFPISPTGLTVAAGGILSNTCGGTPTATSGSGSVTLTGGTVPAASGMTAGSCEIQVQVTASPSNTTINNNYLNTINTTDITSSVGSPSSGTSATLTVPAVAALGTAISISPNPNVRGYGEHRVTYTLTNGNLVPITGIGFSNMFPSIFILSSTPDVATTCGGTVTAAAGTNTVSLSGGMLNGSTSCTISFDITMPDGTVYTDTGNQTLAFATGDITSNEGVSNTPSVRGIRGYSGARFAKSFSPSTIGVGGSSVVTVRIDNYNAADIANFSVTDDMPAGLTTVSGTESTNCPGATVSATATSLSISGATITGLLTATTSCEMSVTVTSNTPGTYTNTIPAATISGIIASGANAVLTVSPTGNISVSKAFSDSMLRSSGQTTLTITASNAGSNPATNMSISDDLNTMGPYVISALAPSSTTCGGTLTADPGTKLVSLTGGTIPANGSCTITVPIRFLANTSVFSVRTNTIPVGAVQTSAGSNITAATATLAQSFAFNLGVTWVTAPSNTLGITNVTSGGTAAVRVQITRLAGVAIMNNVSFTDTLPAGFTVEASPSPVTTCGGTVNAVQGATGFSFSGGTMGSSMFGPADTCDVWVSVRAPLTTGTYTNTIPSGTLSGDSDVGTARYYNPRSRDINVINSPGISKSFSPISITTGGVSTVRIQIANTTFGNTALTNGALTDNLPAGMVVANPSNASLTAVSGTCTGNVVATAGSANPRISSVAIGVNSTCEFKFDVTTQGVGTITNTIPAGALTNSQGITNSGPASASLVTTGPADIVVTKTNNTNVFSPGDATTYTVTVKNNSNVLTVHSLPFTDNEPSGMTFDSWSCSATSGSSCGSSTGNGSINSTVTLAPMGTATFTVNATVSSNYTGTSISNTASVDPSSSGIVDPNPANDSATDTDAVAMDYGDAPDSYGTMSASNGARHIVNSLRLGSSLQSALDGSPSANADGDPADDGVILPASIGVGATIEIPVLVNGSGNLSAWFDWNGNGNFNDPGERVVNNMAITDSLTTTNLSVTIPSSVVIGQTFARFRYCSAATSCNSPTGLATDGEVEDYAITLLAPTAAEGEIEGYVRDRQGRGLPRIKVRLTDLQGNSKFVLTDRSGKYVFAENTVGTNYVVQPESISGVFEPSNRLVFLNDAVENADFIADGVRSLQRQPFNDFDGDGKYDAAVFRAEEGIWYIRQSSDSSMKVIRWGMSGDIPVAADYDGDGITDAAVFRQGIWYILQSGNGQMKALQFGLADDQSAVADYDGDGRADIGVFRASSGTWYWLESGRNDAFRAFQWGKAGDIPTAEDYDGDGKADIAVYRPSEGNWYIFKSGSGEMQVVRFGLAEDKPIAADYDGDGRADIAVYRPSDGVWHSLDSEDGEYKTQVNGGEQGDQAIFGDVDNDGKSDKIIYRQGLWLIKTASSTKETETSFRFGLPTDLPVILR